MPAPNTLPEQLLTERLLIRVAMPGDGQVYNAAVVESLPELAPWLQWASVAPTLDVSEKACRHAYGCFLLDEDLMAFFFDRTSGVLIGGGGLHKADWRLRKFEVGYWCRTGSGGRGLITEAVQCLSDYAMNDLRANRLVLTVDDRNIRSWRLAERTGFAYEGIHRNADLGPDGQLRHLRVYAKTAA
jgi:RimJ/RimL family protein N-acetyltransferase